MSLRFLKSENLTPAKHGFFGREGGSSVGVFTSLNCGQNAGDIASSIQSNRETVAKELHIPEANLLSLQQIHSATVIEVPSPFLPDARPEADAMVSGAPNLGLGVVTADCAPILFSDPVRKIVGAAHAGWKGALNGVAEKTIECMISLGAKRENIDAAIGPCISQRAYEVGQEFLENFMDIDPEYARFFINGQAGKYHFDLPMFVLNRLNSRGINSAEWMNKCTYTNEKEYFSYRRATHRSEPDYGRQLSVITN